MIEKIAYVYASLVQEGHAVNQVFRPDLFIKLDRAENNYLIAITAGLMLNDISNYFFEADVFFQGISVIQNTTKNGHYEIPYYQHLDNGQYIFINTMYVPSVNLEKTGDYEIIVKVIRQEDGKVMGDVVDEKRSFFYVYNEVRN